MWERGFWHLVSWCCSHICPDVHRQLLFSAFIVHSDLAQYPYHELIIESRNKSTVKWSFAALCHWLQSMRELVLCGPHQCRLNDHRVSPDPPFVVSFHWLVDLWQWKLWWEGFCCFSRAVVWFLAGHSGCEWSHVEAEGTGLDTTSCYIQSSQAFQHIVCMWRGVFVGVIERTCFQSWVCDSDC